MTADPAPAPSEAASLEAAGRLLTDARSEIARAAVVVDALLVGLARVALNAHYPSDALASLLAGAGVLGVYVLLTRRRDPDAHEAADAGGRTATSSPAPP